MKQPNPIKVAIVLLFLAIVIGAMFTIGTFFNSSTASNCH